MFAINNIIESAIEKDDNEQLSILVINEMYDDYIKHLTKLNHKFYLVQEFSQLKQWSQQGLPENIFYKNSLKEHVITNLDLIICFNRSNNFQAAFNISHNLHIPLIVINFADSKDKTPLPFFGNSKVSEDNSIFQRIGNFSVYISNYCSQSWNKGPQALNTVIPVPCNDFLTTLKGKILIDPTLPQDFFKQIDIVLDDRFTYDPTQASLYLHLWKCPNTLMFDCMNSEIPVVTLKDHNFPDLEQEKTITTIDNINSIYSKTFLEEFDAMISEQKIIENAKNYVKDNNKQFIEKWKMILKFVSNTCYNR